MRSTTRIFARKPSIGGLAVCAGGYLIRQIGELGGLFWESLAHQRPPHGDGTECHQTIWAVKSHSCALALFQNILKTLKQREPI